MSEAGQMLADYLRRIGIRPPATDTAQHYQLSLLRQWIEHLDEAMSHEPISRSCRTRIIRAMIYGGVPTMAEGEIRAQLSADLLHELETQDRPPRFGGT